MFFNNFDGGYKCCRFAQDGDYLVRRNFYILTTFFLFSFRPGKKIGLLHVVFGLEDRGAVQLKFSPRRHVSEQVGIKEIKNSQILFLITQNKNGFRQ